MKILVLEHPRLPSRPHFNDIANTPLWSCVMAGYVYSSLQEAGFDTTFLDANEQRLDFQETAAKIMALKPDLLTINAVYFWEHTGLFFDMLTDLRQRGLASTINLFGFFPSLHYKKLLAHPAVDSIAIGECEQTIVELAGSLDNPKEVKGLARQNQSLRPREHIKNLDTLPFPHRTKIQLKQTISILASRGCYNHCSFCPIPSFYNDGPLWRGRSVANILKEIRGLVQQGATDFYFIDPNFVGPGKAGKQRILELLEGLRPLKIHFGMETRTTDLDRELLQHLVEAGLTSLLIGVESGSAHGLEHFGKNETVKESERGIALCREAGIEPEIGFLMFSPDSSQQSLGENMNFLARNTLLDRLDRTANLLCHSQIIMAGTSGFAAYDKRGILQPDGPLSFIGKVPFQNTQVATIAATVMQLCHYILRQTGRADSPLYFKNAGNYQRFTPLNDLLVREVQQLIRQPTTNAKPALQRLKDWLRDYSATDIPFIDGVGH